MLMFFRRLSSRLTPVLLRWLALAAAVAVAMAAGDADAAVVEVGSADVKTTNKADNTS